MGSASTPAIRGANKQEKTEQDFREAWHRLKVSDPTRTELKGKWPITISDVCLEAGHKRNALYQNHRDLLREIQTELARLRPKDPPIRAKNRDRTQVELERLRTDCQRLLSQNAALLYRAVTAEERLARLEPRKPMLVESIP